jgi:hypothetical protein
VELEVHPLANEFPMMSELEFESLKHDISVNGCREPIVLFEKKILDGRNRYRACRELGKPFLTKPFEGSFEAARQYSASANLLRRHLTKSQKAMVIVKSGLVVPPGDGGKRRSRGTGKDAIMEVSKKFGVNHVTLYKAAYVFARDPPLAERVMAGELSVGSAEKAIKDAEEGSLQESPVDGHTLVDDTGRRIPDCLAKVFGLRPEFDSLVRALALASRSLNRLCEQESTDHHTVEQMAISVTKQLQAARNLRPSRVCSDCSGKGCKKCSKRGWFGKE